MTDFEILVEMIIINAEHIFNYTHGDKSPLNEKSAINDNNYFDEIIIYGEKFLNYCKAAQALAHAKQIVNEDM